MTVSKVAANRSRHAHQPGSAAEAELRLRLLAPEIVEAVLDVRQPAELQLDELLEGFNQIGWTENPMPLAAMCGHTELLALEPFFVPCYA